MRDGFIIHRENIEDINLLTTEEKGLLLESLIAHYQGEDAEENENKCVTLLSRSMCRRMDRDGEVYEKRANAGSLGGSLSKREAKISKPQAKISKNKQTVSKNKQTVSKPEANLSPVPVPVPVPDPVPDINTPPIPPHGGNGGEDSRFDEFWELYPKKKSKEDARKAWKKLNPNAELHKRILESVREHIGRDPTWKKDNGQFIPYPATWLRAGGWDDVITGHEEENILLRMARGEVLFNDS